MAPPPKNNHTALIEVQLGEAFEISGMEFKEGWSLDASSPTTTSVRDLRVENNREDEDADNVSVIRMFLEGDELLGEVRCSSRSGIGFRQSILLDCVGADHVGAGYDMVTVNNSY